MQIDTHLSHPSFRLQPRSINGPVTWQALTSFFVYSIRCVVLLQLKTRNMIQVPSLDIGQSSYTPIS